LSFALGLVRWATQGAGPIFLMADNGINRLYVTLRRMRRRLTIGYISLNNFGRINLTGSLPNRLHLIPLPAEAWVLNLAWSEVFFV